MRKLLEVLIMITGGAFFGFGLSFSGMVSPEVVLKFLNLQDFGLMLVMGGAVMVTVIFYQLAPRLLKHPLLAKQFETRITLVDKKLLVGSAIFGIGWGICGVCPGPAIAGLGIGNFDLLWALLGMFVGAYLQGYLSNESAKD